MPVDDVDVMEVKIGAPQKCPECGSSNPSGLSLPERCLWCGPTGEKYRVRAMFRKGLKAAQRQNKSGCACRFDEDGNIVELCKAHADYFKGLIDEQ